jgi:hypothetical protein
MSGGRGAGPGKRARRFPRAEYVLPLTIVAAAVMLGISEFMTTFEFTPPGGEPLRSQLASDRHSYALLLLAACAVGAMVFALVSGIRAAAYATAAFGLSALVIFLVRDLPDAGKLGDLDDPTFGLASVRAEPQTGFWMEAAGSVVLGLATLAFATLSETQLRAPLARFRSKPKEDTEEEKDPKPKPSRRGEGKERQRA